MCLLIHQPKGLTFSKKEIYDFVDHNADGFGFMHGDGKLLHYCKMLGTPADVYATYAKHVAGKDAVLHFRMATHGTKTQENAHPFQIVPGIMLAHNGILSIGNPYDSSKTDTEHLVEHFIRPLALQDPDRLFDPKWGGMLGKMIGSSNKLAIVHADGRTALVNEDAGVRYKRAWMSNTYAWSNRLDSKAGAGNGNWKGYGTSPKDRHGAGNAWDNPDEDVGGPSGVTWDTLENAVNASRSDDTDLSELALFQWVNNNYKGAIELLMAFKGYTYTEANNAWERHPDAVTELIAAMIHEAGYMLVDEVEHDGDEIREDAA